MTQLIHSFRHSSDKGVTDMAATPTDTPPVPEDASPETHQPDAAHHDPTTTTAALRTIDQRR